MNDFLKLVEDLGWSYVIKSIKCVKLYSTFYISYTIRTNGLLYLTGHNECPLLTILLT